MIPASLGPSTGGSREPPDPLDDRRVVIAAACVAGAVLVAVLYALAMAMGWL